jgi:hypothetical protein
MAKPAEPTEWQVEFHPQFLFEYEEFSEAVQDELATRIEALKALGPKLGRPHADTLKGSAYANMKELRFDADDGVWRVAFAFDPKRNAVLLVAGDKSGGSEKKFYRALIKRADERYREHVGSLKK